MALFAIAVPILPGKTEQVRRFTDELRGKWARDFAASRRKLGVHERAFLQSTPHGDMMIVTLEGDDPTGAFVRFGAGDDAFTKWFVQQVKELHGIDLNKPLPGSLPELLADSQSGGMSQM